MSWFENETFIDRFLMDFLRKDTVPKKSNKINKFQIKLFGNENWMQI